MLKGAFVFVLGVHFMVLQAVHGDGHGMHMTHVPLQMMFQFVDYFFGKSVILHTNTMGDPLVQFGKDVNGNK